MKFKNLLILFGLLLFVGNSFANDVDVGDQQMEKTMSIDQDVTLNVFVNLNQRGDVGVQSYKGNTDVVTTLINDTQSQGHANVTRVKAKERTITTNDDQRSEMILSLFYIQKNDKFNRSVIGSSGGLPRTSAVML